MEVRADAYLWAIRMYRSRTLAGTAIKGGKVKVNDEKLKPSRLVRIGERYTLSIGNSKKIIEVLGLTDQRGNFETAKKFYADHSPPQEKNEKLPAAFFQVNIKRDKGSGRPTKKDRRDLDEFDWK